MKSVLMSIRKPIADTIFKSWTKRLEYRTRWNSDFKGRVYVYESGKDGGKVAGFFDVGHVFKVNADEDLNDEVLDWLENLEKTDEHSVTEFFRIKVNSGKSHYYAIEIQNPRVFKPGISLEDFNKAYNVDVKRAPQSWQYIEVNNMELFDDCIMGNLVPLAAPPEGVTPTEEFMKKER